MSHLRESIEQVLPVLAYVCQMRIMALDELYKIVSSVFLRNRVPLRLNIGFLLNRFLFSDRILKSLKKAKGNLSISEFRYIVNWFDKHRGIFVETSALSFLIRGSLRFDVASAITRIKLGWRAKAKMKSLHRLRDMIFDWYGEIMKAHRMINWETLPTYQPPSFEGYTVKLKSGYFMGEPELCIADPPVMPEYPAKRKLYSIQYFVANLDALPDIVNFAINVAQRIPSPPPKALSNVIFVDNVNYIKKDPLSAAFKVCKQFVLSLITLYDDVFVEPYGKRLDKISYSFLLKALRRQLYSALPTKFKERGDILPFKDSDVEWTMKYLLMLLM